MSPERVFVGEDASNPPFEYPLKEYLLNAHGNNSI